LRTTVQDRGRIGIAHLGVPRSGAADAFSAALANAIVGNPVGAVLLETTLAGPTLLFETASLAAVTGAVADVLVDGEPVELGVAIRISAGQRLSIGTAREGLRSYLAVAGGLDVAPVLGSRSTDTLSRIGPAPLGAGDVLPIGAPPIASSGRWVGREGRVSKEILASVLPVASRAVRVVSGPGAIDAAMNSLCSQAFSVSQHADRIGVRLTGAVVAGGGEEATAGMVSGAIQLPPDGAPVVLLVDHAVTGGYPVVGVVVDADLPLIAQSRPGSVLRFRAVSMATARKAWAEVEETLASVRTSSR
jgi:biotin-dependent carboxylase-like uncharacterized protein